MNHLYLNAMTTPAVSSFWGGSAEMRRDLTSGRKNPHPRDPFEVLVDVLFSYPYWKNWPKVRGKGLVVGDSGGFSVATTGARIDPEQVIRWQIKNTDIGYILDIPPYRGSGTTSLATGRAADFFDDSLKRTLENVRRALPFYDPTGPFCWWGVCQGETRGQQERWFDAVSEIYPFSGEGEGWAMRPHPNNDLASIARCVRFAADKNIRELHLLQTTDSASVAVLLALAELAGLELVTYDSETAARFASNRSISIRPLESPVFSHKKMEEATRLGDRNVQNYMRSGACACEGCRWFSEDSPAGNPIVGEYKHYIMLHNYCVLRDNFEAIFQAAKRDPDELLRRAGASAYGEIARAFENPRGSGVSAKTRSLVDRL